MPYIGKQPLTGAYQLCDTITTSATATYNLLVGGSAVIPGSANNCIVSLNGVVQAPVGAFTVSGSQITFASALTSSDVIDFILILGNVFDIGTPTNGAVTNSSLNSNVITGQTAETSIAGGDSVLIYDDSASALRKMTRTNFVAGVGGTNTPAFYAYKTGNQNISDSTGTIVVFDAEYYDTNNCFSTSTYKFTPTTAGKYLLIASIGMDINTTTNRFILYIAKNSSTGFTQRRTWYFGTNEQTALNVAIGEANGTTDNFEVQVFQDSGGTKTLYSSSDYTYFQGFKLIT